MIKITFRTKQLWLDAIADLSTRGVEHIDDDDVLVPYLAPRYRIYIQL